MDNIGGEGNSKHGISKLYKSVGCRLYKDLVLSSIESDREGDDIESSSSANSKTRVSNLDDMSFIMSWSDIDGLECSANCVIHGDLDLMGAYCYIAWGCYCACRGSWGS